MLKIRGTSVRSLQLMQCLDFVQNICLWFSEEGTVYLETWNKVGDGLKVQFTDEEPKCMKRQYLLKEQNIAGSRATEPSVLPYKYKFSHKIRIQSKDDLDSDLVSDEEGQKDVLAHRALGTMYFGYPG
jgi:hypothetical protein